MIRRHLLPIHASVLNKHFISTWEVLSCFFSAAVEVNGAQTSYRTLLSAALRQVDPGELTSFSR